jgi:hypothetical protein
MPRKPPRRKRKPQGHPARVTELRKKQHDTPADKARTRKQSAPSAHTTPPFLAEGPPAPVIRLDERRPRFRTRAEAIESVLAPEREAGAQVFDACWKLLRTV